ncbi:MAG TPA: CCA tRNA nucleotidyltransferase [Caulobacteraceae bacterium]|nr:CCA tRNA nucleotidyltransferase [Caulobacteraceae bacterium]
MRRDDTVAVMAALSAAGGSDCARFVGGCVRNTVMKRPVEDIDIATRLTPQAVVEALEAAGLRAVPTGIEHGTITAVAKGRPFEITTLRRDVETDGRRAVVAFTQGWAEDARRRDFTFNALYADAEGRLYDPTGAGLADAAAGRVAFVGEPAARIAEDYLRILRLFRFYAWYGKGEPDAAALAAATALRAKVSTLSAERVQKEVLTLFRADDPRPAVRLMESAGVLTQTLPWAKDVARFESLVEIETEILFANDPVLRLAALLADQGAAEATATALRLSNADRDRLIGALGSDGPRLISWMSPRQARQAVWRLGAQRFCDRVMLAWAGSGRTAAAVQWRALLTIAQTWKAPIFPLRGEEVEAAGVPHGPLVGAVMREVEDWWVENDFPDDKLALIERLKAVAQGMAA